MAANNRRRIRVEWRIWAMGVACLAGLGALTVKIWWLQVAHGSAYTQQMRSGSEVTVRIPAVRGEICDRNGIPLVTNRASYEVNFYLPDMVRGYRQSNKNSVPTISYQAPIHGMLSDIKEANIVKIVNDTVIPRLENLDLARDYNSKQLQMHYRNDREVPYTYLEDIDFPTLAKFSEHNAGMSGMNVSLHPVRQYIYGALASHLLGYVGVPRDITNEPDINDFNFYQPDTEGKSNVELAMDKYLRGKPGVRVMKRNARGQIDGEARIEQPKPGNTVYLTIDARIQYFAEQALRAVGRGAAVIVDPNTGEILAMASVPSYDPNTFIPSITTKAWQDLTSYEANPLVNRAICAFPPGSTFKVVTAMAGVRKGLANKDFTCTGSVTYGNHVFHCWIAEKGGSHGTIGLATALKVSCNAFFYQYGNAAGIDAIDETGTELGLGQPSNIGLSNEQAGVLPGPDWMKIHSPKEKWSSAQTANTSIGQGYDLVTPLQDCMMYATVANGGISYYPRLVKKVVSTDGQPVLNDDGQVAVPDAPRIHGDLRHDFTPEQFDLIKKGLWEVVNEAGGTGGSARMKNVEVAGKTGTATAKRNGKPDTIAWFSGFAPFDQPRYAICVMVNGGEHGGSVAAPIATKILTDIFAMEKGEETPKIETMAPARKPDPFQMIAKVDFKLPNVAAASASDDQETLHTDSEENTNEAQAKPDIKPDADSAGKVANVKKNKPTSTQGGDNRNFLQKFFAPKKKSNPTDNQSAPPKRHWPW